MDETSSFTLIRELIRFSSYRIFFFHELMLRIAAIIFCFSFIIYSNAQSPYRSWRERSVESVCAFDEIKCDRSFRRWHTEYDFFQRSFCDITHNELCHDIITSFTNTTTGDLTYSEICPEFRELKKQGFHFFTNFESEKTRNLFFFFLKCRKLKKRRIYCLQTLKAKRQGFYFFANFRKLKNKDFIFWQTLES